MLIDAVALIPLAISAVALLASLRRDHRSASRESVDDLRRDRAECLRELADMKGQLRVLREDNIVLMGKVLRAFGNEEPK